MQPPKLNKLGSAIVEGCNYHTTWQRNRGMRFVLAEVRGDKARLKTRQTGKDFWTNIDDLIFIKTKHNLYKSFFLHGRNERRRTSLNRKAVTL